MKKFNIILACDLEGGIGYNNNLPWDFSLDKKFELSHLFFCSNTFLF